MKTSFGRSAMLATTALTLGLLASGGAFAQTAINGEGSSLAAPTYKAEFTSQGSLDTHYTWTDYATSSGNGRDALIANTGTVPPKGSGVPTGTAVDFAASDAYISSSKLGSFNTANAGVDGNMIQIPMMGTPIAIAVKNASITANGKLQLTDSDICGVFSGKITTWAGTASGKTLGAMGTINVVTRDDNSGTSFLLIQHLGQVCTTANSAFSAATLATISATPTQTFGSLFADLGTKDAAGNENYALPANFTKQVGSGAVATAVETDANSSALAYISPDFTSIAPVGNSGHHTLLVTSQQSLNGTYYLPNVTNTSLALASNDIHAANLTPPSNATDAANALKWVPALPTPAAGYPIVGYTNWFVPTCYQNSKAAGINEFIVNHLTSSAFKTIITNNGFLPVTNAAYLSAIKADLIGNSSGYNLNIGNTTACAGKAGR